MEARLNLSGSAMAAKSMKHIASASMVIIKESTLPAATRDLVLPRASPVNGCGFCVDVHSSTAGRAPPSTATRSNSPPW